MSALTPLSVKVFEVVANADSIYIHSRWDVGLTNILTCFFFWECREPFKTLPQISFICLNMGCVVYLRSALVRWFEPMWWPQNWFSVIHHFPKCSGWNDKWWCVISTRDNFRTTATLICITSSYTFMTNRPDWDFLIIIIFLHLPQTQSGPSWTFTVMAEIPFFSDSLSNLKRCHKLLNKMVL